MLTPAEIYELLRHPERLNRTTLDAVRQTVRACPAFHAARLLLLENLYFMALPESGAVDGAKSDSAYAHELEAEHSRAVLFLPCPDCLDELLEEAGQLRRKGQLAGDRTMSLLNRYFGDVVADDADVIPENGAAQDYLTASGLSDIDSAEDGPEMKSSKLSATDRMLNAIFGGGGDLSFEMPPLADDDNLSYGGIASEKPVSEESDGFHIEGEGERDSEGYDANDEIKLDENLFTETLAGIYIKQHRYREAIEIIRSLSLTFPNKSSYFADQIRYLEKIVEVNQQKKS